MTSKRRRWPPPTRPRTTPPSATPPTRATPVNPGAATPAPATGKPGDQRGNRRSREPSGFLEHPTELVAGERALLAGVEDTHHTPGAQVLEEMDHHRETRLHVGCAEPVETAAFDARSDVAL